MNKNIYKWYNVEGLKKVVMINADDSFIENIMSAKR